MTQLGKWLTFAPLVAVLTACGSHEPVTSEPPPQRDPALVRTETLTPTERMDSLRLLGTVRSKQTVLVSSRLMAAVMAVHAQAGQRVNMGQSLIELDARELASAVTAAEAARAEAESAMRSADQAIESARAQLDLAGVTHKRFEGLLAKESVSRQEYDESAARVRLAEAGLRGAQSQKEQAERKREQAEAAIAMARTRLSYAAIAAPVSGTVVERLVDPGSLANPGAPLMRIEPSGQYQLELSIPESRIGKVTPGQTLRVQLDALGEQGRVEGRVVEIVPLIDPSSRTFTAKLSLPPHPAIKTGLYGHASLPADPRQVLTIPALAVVRQGQLTSAFVVDGGTARRRLVTLGAPEADRIEVLSGLAAGDQIILDPSAVSDGQPVSVSGGPRP